MNMVYPYDSKKGKSNHICHGRQRPKGQPPPPSGHFSMNFRRFVLKILLPLHNLESTFWNLDNRRTKYYKWRNIRHHLIASDPFKAWGRPSLLFRPSKFDDWRKTALLIVAGVCLLKSKLLVKKGSKRVLNDTTRKYF